MFSSVIQAFQELRVNRLRTFLSLLGITIGIFCIMAVTTVLDSLEANIRESVSSLGSDVLYINRKPWMPEEGEYKWWEYLQRPPLSLRDAEELKRRVAAVDFVTMCYGTGGTVKHSDEELSGCAVYAVTAGFDRLQAIEVQDGRYLSAAELAGSSNVAVIGEEVAHTLFAGSADPVGKHLQYRGRQLMIAGVLKKTGQNMAGFQFDQSIIVPYGMAAVLSNLSSMEWNNDPLIMVKARPGVDADDLRDEVTGALRSLRRLKPGAKPNFSVNQLSQVSEQLNAMFGIIDLAGWIIGGFSLIVGAFGIANIMFVTVKERTRIIGLKKAIGAPRRVILREFLIEAVTLCILGGLAGIGLVWLLSVGLTKGADFPVAMSAKNFLTGVLVSGIVGTLAGILPAVRASKLDPVVAIRSV